MHIATRMKRNAAEIAGRDSTRPSEIWLGFLGMFWGGWLLATWETFASSPGLLPLAMLAPEEVWGGVLVCIGLVSFLSVLIDDDLPPELGGRLDVPLLGRLAGSATASGFWFVVFITLAEANISSTGIPVYTCVSLGAFWVSARVTTRILIGRVIRRAREGGN